MDIKRYLVVLVCSVLVGCSSATVYQLAVSPDGEGMRRELVVTNGGELEEMLGTIFPAPVVEEGVSRYSGSFDAVPADVGGSGTWRRVTSPMGSVYLYAERFRGDDDLVGQVEARLLATDRLADLLIVWFESDLSGDPGWPALRGFMDTQLRHDMKNLSLYVLELERQGQAEDQWMPAYFARVGQYLVDRGYLGDGELQAWLSLFSSNGPGLLGESTDGLLQRMAARRMGLEDGAGVPESLAFLRISDGIQASWNEFRSTEVCAELVGGWDGDDSIESLEVGHVEESVMLVLLSAIGMEFEIFSSPDEVQLTLACASEPLATNGVWDAEAKRVTWDGQVRERFGLPLFFYAYWAESEAEYQEARFGGVLFEGESLVKMVGWYTGLSDESRQRWDGFVGSLDPSGSIPEQVRAARTSWGQEGADPLREGYTQLFDASSVDVEE